MSDEEKNKKIAAKIKALKASASRKSQKSTEKTDDTRSGGEKNITVFMADNKKADTAPDEPWNNSSEIHFTENTAEMKVEFAETLDGQMNLFNFI